jgi:RND family efflux transporter MFP subunit
LLKLVKPGAWGLAVAILAGVGWLVWPSASSGTKAGAGAASAPAPLVSITAAQQTDLPVRIAAQGHLVALDQVDVRPQFNGIVRGVHFHEGDAVAAGQLLFTLDASDATAQLDHARAQAAQSKAQLDDANRELQRAQQLLAQNFVSASAVDTARGKVEALDAQYRASLADVDTARTALDRTHLVAPVAGVTGALSVHAGSLALVSATSPMVNLVKVDPIGVEFPLPETSLDALLTARAAGNARALLQDAAGHPLVGEIVFIDNNVDTRTGTITVKASFPNPRHTLWPGSFARIIVEAGTDRGAVTLPPQAVIEGPAGHLVWALDKEGTVKARGVQLLRIQDRLAVVQGLQGGERVVVEGGQQLHDGQTVRVAP